MSVDGKTVDLDDIGDRLRTEFRADADLPSNMREALKKLRLAEEDIGLDDDEDEESGAFGLAEEEMRAR